MSPDMLKRIFEEGVPDYTAEICPQAIFSDLDPPAIQNFRAMWRRKSGNENLDRLSDEQLLKVVSYESWFRSCLVFQEVKYKLFSEN